jgi:hypothetical protein
LRARETGIRWANPTQEAPVLALRRNLTFANVCSFVALVVALGTGSAYAANTVFSTDIVDQEVKTPDLDTGAVI